MGLGLLATWNWYQLRPQLEKQDCTILKFGPSFDLRGRLREDKASHLMADGMSSFFVINPKGKVFAWISLNQPNQLNVPEEWQMVPKAYHGIRDILIGRDLTLVVNAHGEILLFNRQLVLKWNHGGWHRVTGPPISDLLKAHVSTEVSHRIVDAIVRLSQQRQGALLVITDDNENLLKGASKGIADRFESASLFHVTDVNLETMCRLASIDGAVIIDTNGIVKNAGVILEVPEEFTDSGQGARTAAASFASSFGVAIKVSHDGPVSVYQNGAEIRKVG